MFSLLKNKFILRFFLVFSYKSHSVSPLPFSNSVLAFCSAVEFSSLCLLSKNKQEKKLILGFFFFLFSFFFSFFLDEFMDFVLDMFNCFSYCSLLAITVPEYTLIFFAFLFFLFSLFKFFLILFATHSFSFFPPFTSCILWHKGWQMFQASASQKSGLQSLLFPTFSLLQAFKL